MFILSRGNVATFNPICDRKNSRAGEIGKAHCVRLPDGSTLRKTHTGKPLGEYGIRFNVWHVLPVLSNIDRVPPGQFPESLARDHILSWSSEGDTVLDCFAGSGTTLKMARAMGRHFIGVEVNPAYVEICRKRLAQQVLEFRY
jgi:site-specific DNA-methyltransferase (adenine-specific)